MREKIILILVAILLVGGVGMGYSIYQQQSSISKIATAVMATDSQIAKLSPGTVANVPPGSTQAIPATEDEARLRLANKDWTELYTADSPQGAAALGILKDFRFKNNQLSQQEVATLKQGGLVSDATTTQHITQSDCGETIMSNFHRGKNDEYTPGFQEFTMYAASKDLNKATSIYLSPGVEEDSLHNSLPILFGPYAMTAKDTVASFEHIRCLNLSELK